MDCGGLPPLFEAGLAPPPRSKRRPAKRRQAGALHIYS